MRKTATNALYCFVLFYESFEEYFDDDDNLSSLYSKYISIYGRWQIFIKYCYKMLKKTNANIHTNIQRENKTNKNRNR